MFILIVSWWKWQLWILEWNVGGIELSALKVWKSHSTMESRQLNKATWDSRNSALDVQKSVRKYFNFATFSHSLPLAQWDEDLKISETVSMENDKNAGKAVIYLFHHTAKHKQNMYISGVKQSKTKGKIEKKKKRLKWVVKSRILLTWMARVPPVLLHKFN